MHSVYHFYLVNQPNFIFMIFKISCSCALYSLHLECNLYPHLVIKIIIYILFRRYILTVWLPYWQTQITQLNAKQHHITVYQAHPFYIPEVLQLSLLASKPIKTFAPLWFLILWNSIAGPSILVGRITVQPAPTCR